LEEDKNRRGKEEKRGKEDRTEEEYSIR